MEHTGNYCIVQGLGSVNPYSYPCRHVRASDLWCRRQSNVKVQTSQDNYLLSLSVCAEQIDFDDPDSWEQCMDDLILNLAVI